MIDLDEPEHHIDQRARIAASDLHAAVAFRPMVAIDRHRSRASGQRRTAFAVAGALCALAVVIAGLVWIGDRSADERPTTPDGQPVWTIGDLPEGYAVTMWTGGQASTQSGMEPRLLVFAAGGPGDAAVAVFGPRPENDPTSQDPIPFGAAEIRESTVSGRRVVFGTTADGQQILSVEVDRRWLTVGARLVTESTLQWFAAHVEVDASGAVTLNSTDLPEGLVLRGAGDLTDLGPATFGSSRNQWMVFDDSAATAASVDDSIALTVAPANATDPIMFAFSSGSPQPVELGGETGWLTTDARETGRHELLFQRDGQTFIVSGTRSVDELIAAAKSVRHATTSEYAAMREVGTGGASGGPDTTSVVTAGTEVATADTIPPATLGESATMADVPLTLRRDVSTGNQMTVSGTLPDGFSFRADVVVAAGQARIIASGASAPNGTVTNDLERMGMNAAFQPFGDSEGWWVMTRNPAVTALELIRSNGERYTVSLVATDAYPDVRFGIIGVPRGEVVSARTIDRNGDTVDEVPTGT